MLLRVFISLKHTTQMARKIEGYSMCVWLKAAEIINFMLSLRRVIVKIIQIKEIKLRYKHKLVNFDQTNLGMKGTN